MCAARVFVGLMGLMGLMGVGDRRPQWYDAGMLQPAAASAETMRAEASRASSFFNSAFSAWSCPFSRARYSMRSSSRSRVLSEGAAGDELRNISPLPAMSQSGLICGNMSIIFANVSDFKPDFLTIALWIKPSDTEIFCSNCRVLIPRYSIICFNLSSIV